MRRFFAVLLALSALALPALAQERRVFPLVSLYDLDATSYTYCVTLGQGSVSSGDWMGVPTLVTISSVTVTGTGAFTNVAAGDELLFQVQNVDVYRKVITRASADSITVNAAITPTFPTAGLPFRYRTLSCGTAATSGWFPVMGFRGLTIFLQVDQLNLTGNIDFSVQCRGIGVDASPVDVYSPNTSNYRGGGYTAALTMNDALNMDLQFAQFDSCRVGMKITGTDDGTDTTTLAEQVTTKAVLSGRIQ